MCPKIWIKLSQKIMLHSKQSRRRFFFFLLFFYSIKGDVRKRLLVSIISTDQKVVAACCCEFSVHWALGNHFPSINLLQPDHHLCQPLLRGCKIRR